MVIRIDGAAADVIQAPKLKPRNMRYELSDYDWTDQADAAQQATRRSACK
jgi:hypothetical protein